MSGRKFHAVDYVVFCIMLLISAAIGIYHGCTGGRQRTTSEYSLGNRSMKMLPISISLLVSFLSATTLMGVPAEVFTYGVQYYVVILSYFFIVGISAVVFLPIFYNLRLTSVNEYLELRFTPGIRVLVTCITIVRGLLYSALAIYTPSLALEAVAGIPMTLSVLLTGAVCIFYTTLGGIKAVVWADVFQAFVMVAGIITVMVVGLVNVGGMNEVWRINKERGRLNFFDFDPDPTVRNTFWTLTIGGTFTNLPTWSVAQLFVQRYLALGTLKSAKRALLLNIPFLVFVVTLCCLDGLVIFATYAGCDLRASKRIQRNDQYLELRFTSGVRIAVTFITIIRGLFYLSIVMYTPSLALEAVAGVPMTLSVLLTGAVCIFYTTLGGIKAVVWTNVFQAFVMVAGLITVMVVGTVSIGGINEVWRINKERGRMTFFDFDPDPTVRNTFWTLTIGGTFTLLPAWSSSQVFVQRYLTLNTIKSAKRALLLNIPFLVIIVTLCCLDGLVIFATYAGCDLRASKRIQRNDQVLPFFVIDKLGHLIGIPGLFVSCLFSATLSCLSSAVNSLATVALEDLVKKRITNLTDNEAVKVSKLLALVFGVVIICGAFVVNYLGAFVLQLGYSISGVLGGPLFGLFVLGIFVPRANYKGAYIGLLTGISILGWISIGSKLYPPDQNPGSISIKECSFYNATTYANTTEDGIILRSFVEHSNPLAKLYSLSFYWYGATASAITFVIGSIFSLILESEEDRCKLVKKELLFDIPTFLRSLNPCKTDWKTDRASYRDGDDQTLQKLEIKQDDDYSPVVERHPKIIIEHCCCEKENEDCPVHI